jgi:hypothetical protein
MMTPDTVSTLFTLDELWLLEGVIRHEHEGQDLWHFPYANLDLNDQISTAILFCTENKEVEAPLLLSRGDCLILSYCVQSGMKDPNGVLLGKSILIKSFTARRALRDGALETGTEPSAPSVPEIKAALEQRKED